MQFLADTLGFEGVLIAPQGFEQRDRGSHERVVGEHAAQAMHARVGVDDHERMDAVLRLQFGAPASLGRGPPQAGAADVTDLHGDGGLPCGLLANTRATGVKCTSGSSGKIGREQRAWPSDRRFALDEPGASISIIRAHQAAYMWC